MQIKGKISIELAQRENEIRILLSFESQQEADDAATEIAKQMDEDRIAFRFSRRVATN